MSFCFLEKQAKKVRLKTRRENQSKTLKNDFFPFFLKDMLQLRQKTRQWQCTLQGETAIIILRSYIIYSKDLDPEDSKSMFWLNFIA